MVGTVSGTEFQGRYVHSSGYPTWMGPQLVRILARHDGDLARMLHTLTVKHVEGWSYLTEKAEPPYDFVGPERSVFEPYVGMAYREGGDDELWTGHLGGAPIEVPWGYFFTSTDLTTAELVVAYMDDTAEEVLRTPATQLHKLTGEDWGKAECGQQYERCGHLAWYHVGRDKMPKGTDRIGMRTWLGLDPLTPDDAIGCIKDGKKYLFTGSGSSRGGLWYCGAKYTNGRQAPDVAFRTQQSWRGGVMSGGELLSGVTPIYPPIPTSGSKSA